MHQKTEQEIMKSWQGDFDKPVVSICCITYNHENYIGEALDSFLMQETNFPFEVIVRDDASPDKTADIIREYERKYPNIIKPIYEIENGYQKGIKAMPIVYRNAIGKYFALCEGDDYWTDPLKLDKQVDFLEVHEDYNMVFHNAEIHHYTENGITIKPFNTEDKSRNYTADEILKTWSIPTASVLYRNEAQYRYLDDNPWFPVGDTPLFIKCASLGKLYYMGETMSVYRRVPTGMMNSEKFETLEHHLNFTKYLETLYNDFNDLISKETIGHHTARHYHRVSNICKSDNNMEDYWKYLALAMEYDPEFIYKREIGKYKKTIVAKNKLIKQQQSKINKLVNNRWYRFGQMSNKRKIWTIGKVVSKKIKLYGLFMSLNNRIEKIKLYFNKLQEFIKMYQLSIKYSSDLELKQNNLDKIEKNDILLFSTMKNETFRLPYFLQYYRDLGVDHFIFIDNDSDDGMTEYFKDQKDVSIYYTNKSYKDSNFGVYWLNYLLKKHGSNHWCLTCDPDEFLVYPHIDSRDLKELTSYLDSFKLRSLFAPLIDMYSNKHVDETYYHPGDDPLRVCPYFDKHGYNFLKYNKNYRYYSMKGGVRQRVFNKENPNLSPALHKIPLVKWKKHYAYLVSTHVAIPRFLNENNNPNLTTGVLLHFKFMDHIIKKIAVELDAKQHWDDSYEYKQYNKVLQEKALLFDENFSTKYQNWHTLNDLGLLNLGKW